ncbi:MAG: glycosyltransferase family 2 protein [Oceanidesulfovibrio sp.]
MRVSVVIPAYNSEKFIHRALDSVLMQETNFPFEVIVVNNGSEDGTQEALDSYGDKIRTIRLHPNQGVSGGRAAGIEAAQGELIAPIDSDDYWKQGKLQAQVDFFDAHPDANIGILDTFTEIVNHKGKVIHVLDRVKKGNSFDMFLHGNALNQLSSMMFPKKVYEDIGGFDMELSGVEDYDFCLRVAQQYEVYTLEKVYCCWVHHDQNTTLRFQAQYAQSLKLKAKIRRLFPEDVSEDEYRRLLARSQAYFIPWFFRGGRYGKVLAMTAEMLRNDPKKIGHKSMLFAGLAMLGPLGTALHKTVGRDTRYL